MSGIFQAGDLASVVRLAWWVYQHGFMNEFNATRNYSDFGRDVRALAENLTLLTRVIANASNLANQMGMQNGILSMPVRYDEWSSVEITGNYEETLRECYQLLEKNKRFRQMSGPMRNMEWNMLYQPTADKLRIRLQLHNSKLLLMLKPLEIDLLCRIHQDLKNRITAVHTDVRLILSILNGTVNIDQAAGELQHGDLYFLEMPEALVQGFAASTTRERPASVYNGLPLPDMAEAFAQHFAKSTRLVPAASSGPVGPQQRVRPPVQLYVNLMKCVWLMHRMMDSADLRNSGRQSHWPGYVRQLQEDLSNECLRFSRDLDVPSVADLSPDMFRIWPEAPRAARPVHIRQVMMEQLLDLPIRDSSRGPVDRLRLMRHTGTNGVPRFRAILSASAVAHDNGAQADVVDILDFDITDVVVNPGYALPDAEAEPPYAMIVVREKSTDFVFHDLRDALKFQHALTGYKAVSSFTAYNATANFVISGASEPVVADVCVQLWYPRPASGELRRSDDDPSSPGTTARRRTSGSAAGASSVTRDSLAFSPGGLGAGDAAGINNGVLGFTNPFQHAPPQLLAPVEMDASPPVFEMDTNPPGYSAAVGIVGGGGGVGPYNSDPSAGPVHDYYAAGALAPPSPNGTEQAPRRAVSPVSPVGTPAPSTAASGSSPRHRSLPFLSAPHRASRISFPFSSGSGGGGSSGSAGSGSSSSRGGGRTMSTAATPASTAPSTTPPSQQQQPRPLSSRISRALSTSSTAANTGSAAPSTARNNGGNNNNNNNSSGSSGNNNTVGGNSQITTTVRTGTRGDYGLIHRRPAKPMLVLFCRRQESPFGAGAGTFPSTGGGRQGSQNQQQQQQGLPPPGHMFVATVEIDGGTVVNRSRCGCGSAGETCRMVVIERGVWQPGGLVGGGGSAGRSSAAGGSSGGNGAGGSNGSARFLGVRRFDSWDLGALAQGRGAAGGGGDGVPWRSVERLTLAFHAAEKRREFAGVSRPCGCQGTDTNAGLKVCIDDKKHEGIFGQVRNKYRKQLREWEKVVESQQDVVSGTGELARLAQGCFG